MLNLFWDVVRELETRIRQGDQTGFYKHLKTLNLGVRRDRSSAYIKDEDGILLKNVNLLHEQCVRWFHTLLNSKSPKLGPNIAKRFGQWPENMPLSDQPKMQELPGTIHSLANGKAVDRTESTLSCSRSLSTMVSPCAGDCSISSFVFGGRRGAAAGEVCHHWGTPQKYGSERVRQLQGYLPGSVCRQGTTEDHRSQPQ